MYLQHLARHPATMKPFDATRPQPRDLRSAGCAQQPFSFMLTSGRQGVATKTDGCRMAPAGRTYRRHLCRTASKRFAHLPFSPLSPLAATAMRPKNMWSWTQPRSRSSLSTPANTATKNFSGRAYAPAATYGRSRRLSPVQEGM